MATYKKLCIDAASPARLGPFWAELLDLAWQPDATGEGGLVDETGRHLIWFNRVPAPTITRQRIRLDIVRGTNPGLRVDPEGGEYRVSAVDPGRTGRLRRVEVDCDDPAAQALWWADVFGVEVVLDAAGSCAIEPVSGIEVTAIAFLPGAASKSAPNRIHWDINVAGIEGLTRRGATLLRPIGGDIAWHVLADPEGNEFCAFTP
jgi:glyoxalase superfamily protein